MGRVEWGEPGFGEGTRSLMSDAYWRKPLAWDKEAWHSKRTPTVFPSLCDPFDTAVPEEWRARFMDLIFRTPNLTWLLLTKRIGNVRKLVKCLPGNAALGSTFANQEEWDRDAPKLRDAVERFNPFFSFASFEPMLSHVDMAGEWQPDWIICGGETNQGQHRARESDVRWFRSLKEQAQFYGKRFHLKQITRAGKAITMHDWPNDLLVQEFSAALD
jgi:protein gp37